MSSSSSATAPLPAAVDPHWLRVPQAEVKLLPSEPCVLLLPPETTTTTFPLLPELERSAAAQVFRPYLASLPEEDQMAVALRLEMEHMRDIYILDRTVGYSRWAAKHPEAHAQIQAAKPAHQTLVLPPRLDDVLAALPDDP